jgi:S1-C subfamily serine protease
MHRVLVAFALTLFAPGILLASESSLQEALLRAKPAVALVIGEVAAEVTLTCSPGGEKRVSPKPLRETGTGWFVAPSGWMLTNAHVVSSAHNPRRSVEDQLARRAAREACPELGPQGLAATVERAKVKLEPSVYAILSNGIRLPAVVVKYSPPVVGEEMSGRDLALLKLEAADMPTLALAQISNAQIGDRIHILGFPGVVLSHELLNASAKMEASVTNGAISSFKQDRANQPVIQTDAPAAWGNSGGPAVTSMGTVLGVLTFVSMGAGDEEGIVQGFNFVIPSTAVRDFLKGTAAPVDETSRFNVAWHAGLSDFFAGNYTRAAQRFAEANRLLPELPDVRRLLAEAQNPPARPFPWASVAIAVIAASFAGYGVLLGLRWRRNRFRIRPSQVMQLLESAGGRPIILDVRDEATYGQSPVRIPGSTHVTAAALESRTASLEVERERIVVAYCT